MPWETDTVEVFLQGLELIILAGIYPETGETKPTEEESNIDELPEPREEALPTRTKRRETVVV